MSSLQADLQYEAIAEQIDALPGVFGPEDLDVTDVALTARVLDDFIAAGFLRVLDVKSGGCYVRSDVSCIVRETQMHLYRCYSERDELLYIGVSSVSAEERIAAHARSKPWWGDVARIDVTVVSGYRAGLDAERRAIASERPLHNKHNNPAWRKQVPA